MSLTAANLNVNLSWTQSKANTGFGATQEGPDSQSFTLGGISLTAFDEIYLAQLSVAASTTTVIDLTSVTNLLYQSVAFAHALTILIKTSGNQITYAPDTTNGLAWFLGGTTPTITIPDGGCFCFSEPVAGPGRVVDSTHKRIKLTNNGSVTAATVTIGVLGGTT